MRQKYNQKFLIIGSLLSLLLSLFLFGGLILSATYNHYRDVQISLYGFTGKNIAESINRIARLGIEPSRMADLSSKIKFYAKEYNKIVIVDKKDNAVLAKWNYPDTKTFSLPLELESEKYAGKSFTQNAVVWTVNPVLNRSQEELAYVLVGIEQRNFSKPIYDVIKTHFKSFLLISLFASLLLIFLCYLVTKKLNTRTEEQKNEHVLIFGAFLAPLILAQFFISLSIKPTFTTLQSEALSQTGSAICSRIIQDIEHIDNLGVSFQSIQDSFARYTQTIQNQFPWIKNFQLVEKKNHFTFSHGEIITETEWEKSITPHDVTASYSSFNRPYTLNIVCDTQNIQKNLFGILLDTLTMTLISFVFMVEMLYFLILKEETDLLPQKERLSDQPKFMRTIIFLCIFGTSMPISFLPMRMAEISSDLFGLPKDIVMGLPLSCETLITGAALFFGGIMAQKKGWRPLMLWGSLLVTIGSIGSGIATDALTYIVSRCLSGYGYGYIYLMSQVYVIAKSNQENRTANISAMLAGLYAGLLCGSAFGGLVADRFGYVPVFLVIASVIGVLGLCIFFFVPKEEHIAFANQAENKTKEKIHFKEICQFFANPKMASLLLMHIIPCAFVTTCLFQFYVPVSLDNAGVSPAGIGRVTMIFCLVIVYIGPYLGIVIDKSKSKATWIFYADLVGIIAIMALAWFSGLWAAILAVFLLGVCNTIVYSVQGVYALELPATKIFGEAKAMTVYNVAERIGQVLGPITLGLTISLYGGTASLYGMALVFFIMCVIFLFISRIKD